MAKMTLVDVLAKVNYVKVPLPAPTHSWKRYNAAVRASKKSSLFKISQDADWHNHKHRALGKKQKHSWKLHLTHIVIETLECKNLDYMWPPQGALLGNRFTPRSVAELALVP